LYFPGALRQLHLHLLDLSRYRQTLPAPPSAETAEPIVDLLNRGVSVPGSRRERLTAKRSRPEMAPQRFEKIESGPGNGRGSEASNLQDLVSAGLARLRLTSRGNDEVAMFAMLDVAEKGA
jgi:hypothetical protein